jgi:hypothetical protein
LDYLEREKRFELSTPRGQQHEEAAGDARGGVNPEHVAEEAVGTILDHGTSSFFGSGRPAESSLENLGAGMAGIDDPPGNGVDDRRALAYV